MPQSADDMLARLAAAGCFVPAVKWEDEIRAFEAADAADPPAPGQVLFLGDSDIRFWREDGRFERDFAGLAAINRGFGGARTWEMVAYFPRIVEPYAPGRIVYNCGDNDLLAPGVTDAMILAGFRVFVELVRERLPLTGRIFYTSIKPCPKLLHLWPRQQRVNELIRAYCAGGADLQFIDYWQTVLNPDGTIRQSAFRADGVHLAPAHYGEWTAILRPLIDR
jgi:hypothetical protein